jgi:hypothetical protein
LRHAIESKVIKSESFGKELDIRTGGPGLRIRKVLAEQDLLAAGSNNLLASLGTAALATDKALDATFGSKEPEDTSLLGSLRAIFYQTRNAFAHDPFNPVWSIKGKYHRLYWENNNDTHQI